MNTSAKRIVMGLSLPLLLLAEMSPESPLGVRLVPDAAAVIGIPWSPVSYAGVARRTTRRVVAVESAAVASTAAAAQPQQAAPASVATSSGALAVGTIVTALPAGCASTPSGGVEYYTCGGTRYRPAFQGNNLVYVVQ